MRVAFTLIGGNNWIGGYNYLLNLLNLINKHEQDYLTPVVFVGDTCNPEYISDFENIDCVELVKTPLFNTSRNTSSLIQAIFYGRDIAVTQLFQQQHIDVVFESARFFGWRLGIPTIAWFPDFQHKLLPHLFSYKAWWKRELGFRIQITSGRTIMLSSNDAKSNCEHYYSGSRGQTQTVHFAVPSNSSNSYEDARKTADSYNLPTHFFFMPNQFWRHKNHNLVLDALNILRQRDRQIVIAVSGKQNDPQAPEYFPELLQKINQSQLEENFRLLGVIPYSHIALLMQACSAFLNPSLFEGWSTTVEEARSMGVPMLLSNLDVHYEQMGDEAHYFDRNSAQSLADALDKFKPLNESEREYQTKTARENNTRLTKQFARDFVNLANHCAIKAKAL